MGGRVCACVYVYYVYVYVCVRVSIFRPQQIIGLKLPAFSSSCIAPSVQCLPCPPFPPLGLLLLFLLQVAPLLQTLSNHSGPIPGHSPE